MAWAVKRGAWYRFTFTIVIQRQSKMKKHTTKIIIIAIIEAAAILLMCYYQKSKGTPQVNISIDAVAKWHYNNQLKADAFEVLDTKCNVCHRKRNPFMVFSPKNMEKRAPKIYKQVFVEKRMPKGDDIKLTSEEYDKLEKWLFTQKIY